MKGPIRQSIFERAPPRLFSIDAGRPFLDDLAAGLIDSLPSDPLAAARALILVPTRRARRSLAGAFLDAHEKRGRRSALLPRLMAIGDVEEDEFFLADAEDEIDIAPAIPPTERLVTLSRLVAAGERRFAGQTDWPAAVSAARELGKLLDSLYTEEIPFGALKRLDVADSAGHWAQALDFLKIATEAWPAYLAEIGRADPAERRARLIAAQARGWRNEPPDFPVIIAGTTASAPSTTALVEAVARLPRGAVILPGLDRDMDEKAWGAIEDAHPQAGLKALLEKLGAAPASVASWPCAGEPARRAPLLSLALRPAEATHDWLKQAGGLAKADPCFAAARAGLALIEADDEDREAAAIAILFRESVEKEGATAILVTPDRKLARRVALKMRRWKIDVEDSAGVPFANSVCGTFLRLVAEWLEDQDDPVATLALLDHPMAGLGLDPAARRAARSALDRALRGPRIGDLADLRRLLVQADRLAPEAGAALEALVTAAAMFSRQAGAPFATRLAAHIEAAEALAADHETKGADRLWRNADGETGAALIADLASVGSIDGPSGRRYAEIFSALIADQPVRKTSAAHPRLAILGPLEARLLKADHFILGGLNEGAWPADAPADPFLSRQMREQLGLPSPERALGLAAHDFAQLAAQPKVTLTRARRTGGAPAKPSRFLVRLKTVLAHAGALARVDRSAEFASLSARLDAPERVSPASRPLPRAGPDRRPSEVSVTRIEDWLRDPYGVYARYILRLRKLDAPGIAFGPREMGSMLHEVFFEAARRPESPTALSLRATFETVAARKGFPDEDRGFWAAAIEDSLKWFAQFDAERRERAHPAVLEGKGALSLAGIDPPFTLTAIADRIDLSQDGAASIIDYKSGKIRTEKQDKSFSPQLALTGLIVARGGFQELGASAIAGYEYVKILGRKADPAENGWGREGAEAAGAILNAEARLRALIAAFDDPSTVYHSQPRPEFVKDYGDYDQLARRKEWGAADEGEAE